MIFGVHHILNMAHGAVFMWGAFVGLFAVTRFDLPFPVAFVLAVVLAGLLSVALDWVAFRPLRKRGAPEFSAIISSIGADEEVVEPLVLMTAPLAPHVAEELWERLGHERTLTYEDFPKADPQWLEVETVEITVQVNGKVRARLVPAGLDEPATEAAARADEHVVALLEGRTVRKVIRVPGRLVNFVVG